jgi:hypothetical protein
MLPKGLSDPHPTMQDATINSATARQLQTNLRMTCSFSEVPASRGRRRDSADATPSVAPRDVKDAGDGRY